MSGPRAVGRWLPTALLLLLGLLAGGAARAQVPPGGAPDSVARAPHGGPTRADSMAALRQLFARERREGRGRVLPLTASLLTFNFLLAYSQSNTTWARIGTGLLVGFQAYTVYRLADEIGRARRYRPAREQRLLADLAAGRPLPPRLAPAFHQALLHSLAP